MTETEVAAAMTTGETFKETHHMAETDHTIDIENTAVAAVVTIINPTVTEGLIVVNTTMIIDQDIDPLQLAIIL
jgi:hypothetical protein